MRTSSTSFRLNPRTWTISWKISALYAAMLSVFLIVLTGAIPFGVWQNFMWQTQLQLASTRDSLVYNISYKMYNEDDLDAFVSEAGVSGQTAIKVTDEKGQVLASSEYQASPEISVFARSNTESGFRSEATPFIFMNSRIKDQHGRVYYVQVAENLAHARSFVRSLFYTLGAADLLGLMLSLLAGMILSKRLLEPIDAMTRTAGRISASDLDSRLEVSDVDDEVSRLGHTLNDMLDRLGNAFEQQSHFISDASHELRTPVAVIRAYTSLLDRWGKQDPMVLEEAIATIDKETSYMMLLI
ncbi:MAG: histidine kinase dimerization/phospho-acceptor domain-containing protein, partial [Candidatus Saccharibacteria bacterium]